MEKQFPVSELFDSVQGEGLYAGTRFFFIRLSGCTVGKPFPGEKPAGPDFKIINTHHRLPVYTEQCTTYDGRHFECDTDYRVKERLTAAEIVSRIPLGTAHVCFTGGEPMMHNLLPLAAEIDRVFPGMELHIETSGTIPVEKAFGNNGAGQKIWISVSPKFNVLPKMILRANELKLLIDADFAPEKLPREVFSHPLVWIQPINQEFTVDRDNLKRCIDLQQLFPSWRISIQLHKILSVR